MSSKRRGRRKKRGPSTDKYETEAAEARERREQLDRHWQPFKGKTWGNMPVALPDFLNIEET